MQKSTTESCMRVSAGDSRPRLERPLRIPRMRWAARRSPATVSAAGPGPRSRAEWRPWQRRPCQSPQVVTLSARRSNGISTASLIRKPRPIPDTSPSAGATPAQHNSAKPDPSKPPRLARRAACALTAIPDEVGRRASQCDLEQSQDGSPVRAALAIVRRARHSRSIDRPRPSARGGQPSQPPRFRR